MKVKVEYSGVKDEPGREYEARCSIWVDGSCIADAGNFSECPEDANLGRDLSFVYELPEVLRLAHEAGANGEPFEVEEVENTDD